ncbi:MAG TPA: GNAT family N-acetyltransferase [Friedmanniella sp.]
MITARPLVEADLPTVLELLHAYDRRWFGEALLSVEDVRADWAAPLFDLAVDSEGWDEDGTLVAFGTLGSRGEIELGVRDDWAGAGLEDALLERWETEARRRGLEAVRRDLPVTDEAGLARLRTRGWVVLRTGWMLRLSADAPVARRTLPDGYAVRPLAEADVEGVHRVMRDAFAPYGSPPRSYDWRAAMIDRPDLVLGHCRVATWRGELVGACLLNDPAEADPEDEDAAEPEAWVPQLAVADGHRRRGVARELLAATVLAARGRGVPQLALYTHADTGALGLYEDFGMVVRHTLAECALTL